jgi:hypothetical protein
LGSSLKVKEKYLLVEELLSFLGIYNLVAKGLVMTNLYFIKQHFVFGKNIFLNILVILLFV